MKTNTKILAILMGSLLFSCSQDDLNNETDLNVSYSKTAYSTISNTYSFSDLTGWRDASQIGTGNYQIVDGNLNIYTHANTWERSKVKTISNFGAGKYSWNVYVPEMGVGDMASIGSFLYSDDAHELDFEIGYGTQAIRQQLSAQADDLIVYMTSQANPFFSTKTKIKRNQWYNLKLELTLNSKGRYIVNWKIDDKVMATAQLSYGKNTKFYIFCSVENLQFMGDHIPYTLNQALFNTVEFTGN